MRAAEFWVDSGIEDLTGFSRAAGFDSSADIVRSAGLEVVLGTSTDSRFELIRQLAVEQGWNVITELLVNSTSAQGPSSQLLLILLHRNPFPLPLEPLQPIRHDRSDPPRTIVIYLHNSNTKSPPSSCHIHIRAHDLVDLLQESSGRLEESLHKKLILRLMA